MIWGFLGTLLAGLERWRFSFFASKTSSPFHHGKVWCEPVTNQFAFPRVWPIFPACKDQQWHTYIHWLISSIAPGFPWLYWNTNNDRSNAFVLLIVNAMDDDYS